MQHEFIRDNDGVIEHCVFTSYTEPGVGETVIVKLEVMTEMLMAVGFRPLDTVAGDVVVSETTTK
jgi:hypothetical protein